MVACASPQARSRMFATDFAYHCPPRAVATPRAFKADAISLRVAAPAFCASRMIGSTLAANLSASVVTASSALLRATESLGLPRVTPRAFAAARACRVRVEIRERSFSASAANRWRTNGSTSGPSYATRNGTLWAMRPLMK
jgi:hypothetical protein